MNSKTTYLTSFLLVVVHSAVIIDPSTTGLDPVQTFLGAAALGLHSSDDVDHIFSDEIHEVNDLLEDIFDGKSHELETPLVGVNLHSAEHEDSHGDLSNDHSRDRDYHEDKHDSRDGDNDDNSKDNDNHSKENDSRSKDKDNHSKDNDNHSKENNNDSKEDSNKSRDKDNDSKDKDKDSKDKDNDSKDKDNKSNERDNDNKSKDNDDKSRDNDRSDDRDSNRRSGLRRSRKDKSDEDNDDKDDSDEKVFRNLLKARGYLEAFESWRESKRAAQAGTCPLYPVNVESDTITITTQNGCKIVIQLKGVGVDNVRTVQESLARAVSVLYTSDE